MNSMQPGVYRFTSNGLKWSGPPAAAPVPIRSPTGTGLEWMEGLSVKWTPELREIVEAHTEVFQIHKPPRCHTRRMCLLADCLTKCYGLATRPSPPSFHFSPSSDWLPMTPPLSPFTPTLPTPPDSPGLFFGSQNEFSPIDLDLDFAF